MARGDRASKLLGAPASVPAIGGAATPTDEASLQLVGNCIVLAGSEWKKSASIHTTVGLFRAWYGAGSAQRANPTGFGIRKEMKPRRELFFLQLGEQAVEAVQRRVLRRIQQVP